MGAEEMEVDVVVDSTVSAVSQSANAVRKTAAELQNDLLENGT
jgi:hypothetical protein